MSKKLTPEDAFYDNLTLGLMKTLLNIPRISNVTIEKREPCEKTQVLTWEQRHCVYMPEDMKRFYLSTDGFLLQWSYQYSPNDVRRVGYIHIPHLVQVTLLREHMETSTTTTVNSSTTEQTTTTTANGQTITGAVTQTPKDQWGNETLVVTAKTKIFEFNSVNDVAKVCLVYESTNTNNPKLYLLELNTLKWVYLAETFSEYLRMCIAHLGLPFWELCFSTTGLPPWTEQLFLLLAPHLLENHEPRGSRTVAPASEHPYNTIDPTIFRVKPKSLSKAAALLKQHKN